MSDREAEDAILREAAFAQLPDRTRRAYDVLRTHVAAQGAEAVAGRWIAIRLSDGSSDGVLYDSKKDATRFQLHETQCAYICIPPFSAISPKEMGEFLDVNEMIYNAGGRLSDVGTHIVTRHS